MIRANDIQRDALLAPERAKLAERLRARVWSPGYSPSTHAEQLRQTEALLRAEAGSVAPQPQTPDFTGKLKTLLMIGCCGIAIFSGPDAGAGNTRPALNITPLQRSRAMPVHTVADAARVGNSPLKCAVILVREGTISVDDDGRVWKLFTYQCGRNAKIGTRKRLDTPRRLDKPMRSNDYVKIQFKVAGKMVGVLVHRLVWALTHGDIPDGLEVNHIDCDKQNNRLSNLELVTPQENREHARRMGRKIGRPPTYSADVLAEAIRLRREGRPVAEVSSLTGVSLRYIHRIYARSMAASTTVAR